MLPLDNLKTGMWVAIEANREPEDDVNYDPYGSMVFGPKRRRSGYPINGKPLKVIAISLPFVCVTDGLKRYSLDMRECSLVPLNKKYVQKMWTQNVYDRAEHSDVHLVRDPGVILSQEEQPKSRRQRKKDARGLCPVCGHKLSQLLVRGAWILNCRQCGFQGGQPNEK